MADEKDVADSRADKYEARQRARAEIGAAVSKEHELPGGKNNPIHSQIPGADSSDPLHQQMAKHSADFIAAATRGDRGKAEAARTAFHTVGARSRGIPKGMEAPCPSGGCKRTNVAPQNCESTGGCKPIGGAPLNVRRPRD